LRGACTVGRFLHGNVGGKGAQSLSHADAGEPFVVDDENAFDGGRHGSAGSAGMEVLGRSTMWHNAAWGDDGWMNRASAGTSGTGCGPGSVPIRSVTAAPLPPAGGAGRPPRPRGGRV